MASAILFRSTRCCFWFFFRFLLFLMPNTLGMTSIRCDNCCQNELNGLRYKGFSLVFIQTFVLPDNFSFSERKALKTGLFEKIENDIDSQIFMLPPDSGYIRRYRLHGFKM